MHKILYFNNLKDDDKQSHCIFCCKKICPKYKMLSQTYINFDYITNLESFTKAKNKICIVVIGNSSISLIKT